MIFTRMSSRLLFLRTVKHDQLEKYLVNYFKGNIVTLENALTKASEESSLIFITPTGLHTTRVEDAISILHVPFNTSVILMRLINEGKAGLIERAQLGPGFLIMRTPEKRQAIVERIKEEYNGRILSFNDGIGHGESEDTLLAFTDRPINRYMAPTEKDSCFLLVSVPINKMQSNIRRDAVRYITESMADTQWYEYRINIYDARGRYMEQLERLMLVLSDLEAGFVLAQRWTRDHALVLYSVTAYQIRIFSLMPPKDIKRLLVGLEYDSKGQRFVDMDLYYRNRKIEFVSIEKGIKKRERPRIGAEMRERILAELSGEMSRKFLGIEKKLSDLAQ